MGALLFGSLVVLSLAPSEASAQVQPGCTSTLPTAPTNYNVFTPIIGGVVGAANSISSVIGTVNTAFQAQGDAFAVGLPNAQPDQIAGGTWARMIGGRVDNQATGTFNGSISAGSSSTFANNPSGFTGGPGASGTVNCHSDIRQDYSGFQLGQDLARLNLSGTGATLHVGVTGGYAQSDAQDLGGSAFTGGFQVPFAGLYAVYASGKFFADALVRSDFYQMDLGAAPAALGSQRLDGFGLTEAISAGYQIDVGNNWFVEPSFSGIHSTTRIDTLNFPGGAGNTFAPLFQPPGSVQFNNIESWLGRAGLRVGTSFTGGNVLWQPFATASVWHEFAGNITANYNEPEFFAGNAVQHPLVPCATFPETYPNGCGNAVSGTVSGSRVGTYGQYSVGIFGQMAGSPWLGYLRLDYKDGANIEALSFNAGLRYQFDPTLRIPAGALFDGPPRVAAYDWTGFYVGGFSGADWGRTIWNFPAIGTSADPQIAGVMGGGTLGYNKQIDRWVVGGEGDIAFTNAAGGQSCQNNALNFNIAQNCDNDVRVLATAAARVGYTWLDRVLLFAKAGGAWTNNALDVSCNGDANFFQGGCFPANAPLGSVQNLTVSDPRFGWTVGTGFELALTPAWSAKLEYDYLDFGSKSFVLSDTTPLTVREYFNEVKFGLNYHFNAYDPDPGAPTSPTMAVKALVKAPPPTPYNWTGAYAGAETDFRMAEAGWNTTALPVSALLAPPGITVPDPTTSPAKFFNAAAQGGAFVGYDWQVVRRWVAGVEGDVAFGNSSMGRAGIPGTFGNGSATAFLLLPGVEALQADSSAVKFGWDGSIRARFGYLFTPNVLMYGTGGVAFQQISVTANCSGFITSYCDSARRFFTGLPFIEPPKSETASKVETGWTVGGGVESVLTGNWLGKVEFRYANFGRFNHAFFAGTLDEVDMSVRSQTYTFLAGVGYKFHGTGSLIAQ